MNPNREFSTQKCADLCLIYTFENPSTNKCYKKVAPIALHPLITPNLDTYKEEQFYLASELTNCYCFDLILIHYILF